MNQIGKTAIVLPPIGGDWSVAAEQVAGVPLLSRILISVERAGVHRVIICAGEAAPRLQALVAERPPRSQLHWIGTVPAELARALGENGSSPCFFIRASTLLNPAVLMELRAAYRPDATLVVPADQGPDTPVALRIPGNSTGHQKPPAQIPLSGDAVCLDLATTPVEAVAATLYQMLGKPTDSRLIRWSRRLLAPIMRQIAETPLTANHLTLLGFLIGLGAIGCLWQGTYMWTVAGAAFFVVSYFIDLMDGMLARLKLQESQWGGWMDYALDNLVHLGIFAAITRAVYVQKPEQTILILGTLLLAGAVAAACTMAAYMRLPWRPINRLMTWTMHRDFSVLVLIAALLKGLEWFLWTAAVGINLFWPLMLYFLIRDRRGATRIMAGDPGASGAHVHQR